jgi:hypothetical protein
MVNFRRIDLNLLATLDVLLTELNVTRAAQRLNLSQPSVSVQLARLREIFADPLLLPDHAACNRPPAPMNCGYRYDGRSMRWKAPCHPVAPLTRQAPI